MDYMGVDDAFLLKLQPEDAHRVGYYDFQTGLGVLKYTFDKTDPSRSAHDLCIKKFSSQTGVILMVSDKC